MIKPNKNSNVADYLGSHNAKTVFLNVVTETEIIDIVINCKKKIRQVIKQVILYLVKLIIYVITPLNKVSFQIK